MRSTLRVSTVLSLLFLATSSIFGEEILFQDNFKAGLSKQWKIVGLKEGDYRIRNGGLELHVQPGKLSQETPMLKVILPFTPAGTTIASVKVTPLDKFTQDGEVAGVYLINATGIEFEAAVEQLGGKLYYMPAEEIFKGKEGEENDASKYEKRLVETNPEAGPLRLIVDRGDAFFQVGPSKKNTYHTHFYSAVNKEGKDFGFAIIAAGAPKEVAHWVRFEEFKVITNK